MDEISKLKEKAKEGWSSFIPFEALTSTAAPKLIRFANIDRNSKVLDVACGTCVVGLTAARIGALVKGLDLTPALIGRARENSKIMSLDVEFVEGDAENMPFLDEEFDIVVSQYGHMFAPQPDVVIDEMGRVLKTGGVLAFSTWPSEMFMGQFFKLVGEFSPPLPDGASSPVLWGDTKIISERLEKKFKNIEFARDAMMAPTLSPGHMLNLFEKNAGPLAKLVEALADNTSKLQDLRTRTLDLISKFFLDNYLRQDFLMTKCIKK
jgi:ubiquinone/menaquinone biosynthesis C-methylase UbiE